ncbi:MAG: hypothetical protein M5U26_10615 [Planctomycetota bacterium]|nr:hypothetical protein [Planctomycetota bacterium]
MSRAAGIDIGTESLRGMVLEFNRGKLQVVSAGTMPLGELGIMSDSEDKRLAVTEKLKELVKGASLKAPQRRVSIPIQDGEVRYLTVPPVPPWRLEMLVKYEIEERSNDRDARTFDYRILDVPDIGGQYTVLMGTCTEKASQAALEQGRAAGLGEIEIDLQALSLYNAYYHGHGFDPGSTAMVVDIGAQHITALLVKGGNLYLARTFVGGSRRFSEVLSEALKATILEADELKKNEAEILFDLAPPTTAARSPRLTRMIQGRLTRRLTKNETEGEPGETGAPAPGQPPQLSLSSPGPAGETPEIVRLEDDLEAGPSDRQEAVPAGEAGASAEEPAAAAEAKSPVEQAREWRRRTTSMALVREAAALCAQLENMVTHCRTTFKLRDLKLDTIYLTGAGSRLKGLQEFVSRRMRTETKPLEVLRNIDLSRLSAPAAEALKSEQDGMAIAAGSAIGGLCKGAFTLMLWPKELVERKDFWARGAFLYYAAAMLLAAMGLFMVTPWRNEGVLAENKEQAEQAIRRAKNETNALGSLNESYEELTKRLDTIDENVNSGQFLLSVLAALKESRRCPKDIFVTQITSTMPKVVLENEKPEESPGNPAQPAIVEPGSARVKPGEKTEKETTEPLNPLDTLQAQARIYIRGYARGNREGIIDKIRGDRTKGAAFQPGFCDLLVPYPDTPYHPDNVFKEIRPIWVNKDDQQQGALILKEFVLEAYAKIPREKLDYERKLAESGGKPAATPVVAPAEAPQPAQPQPVQPKEAANPLPEAKTGAFVLPDQMPQAETKTPAAKTRPNRPQPNAKK